MRNILILIVLLVGQVIGASAQRLLKPENFRQYITLGFNLGASAPYGLPNTIREINSYSPAFSPSLGYELDYDLSDRWSVGTGLRFDLKGMHVKDSVQYFRTLITVQNENGENGSFEGDFSGTNSTSSRNGYLTVPFFAGYHLKKWQFNGGLYIAYLIQSKFEGNVSNGYIRKGGSLGEKVLIDHATFDFSDKVNNWDYGLHVDVNRHINERWQVRVNGQIGLNPLFPSSFQGVSYELYNMFFTIGAAYRL